MISDLPQNIIDLLLEGSKKSLFVRVFQKQPVYLDNPRDQHKGVNLPQAKNVDPNLLFCLELDYL